MTPAMIENRAVRAAFLVSTFLFASIAADAQINRPVIRRPPPPAEPCCGIVAVNVRTGIVTAKINATGNVFEFKANNPAILATLKPGRPVYANFANQQISLDGRTACCMMTSAPRPAPIGAIMSRATTPPARVEVVKTNLTLTSSSDEHVPLAHHGVKSSDDENAKGEKDSFAPVAMRAIPISALSSKSRRLKDDPNVQAYLDKAKSLLNGFEINTALLAGHKYMITSCLGIKVSAGEFVLRVPDPDLRVDNTGMVLTFAIPHMEMSGFKLRFRPDLTDPTEMCHFSGRYGVGASADDLRLELHFDPILDLEKCKIGSMGHITQIWRIGKLRMSPLPTEVSDMAGNIIEDALTNGANLNLADRIVAGFNAVAGLQCHA